MEGIVLVTFTLDAEGRLLDYSLVQGSGVAGLDRAALQLLKEAEPYPAIPDALGLKQYALQVPVRYSLE